MPKLFQPRIAFPGTHPPGSLAARVIQQQARRPREFAQLYQFPLQFTGKGISIGLIELGGGFDPTSLDAFLPGLSDRTKFVSVDGAANSPDGAMGAQGEVEMDIEVCGDCLQDATFAVYTGQNTDASFINAMAQSIAENPITSFSWGGPFDENSDLDISRMDEVLMKAPGPVFGASGDQGSRDGEPTTMLDYPSGSLYAISVGGTTMIINGDKFTETVWNQGGGASGGGFTTAYPVPTWQRGLTYLTTGKGAIPQPLIGRGAPDCAAVADPNTGYWLVLGGVPTVAGGTSAAAPLWAALYAMLYQAKGMKHIPNFRQLLYDPGICRDVLSGSNGDYQATAGWDAATGNGSPNGAALLAAVMASKS